MGNSNETTIIRQALELVVEAHNVGNGELPTYLKEHLRDVSDILASEIGYTIQFGGGRIYINSEEEDENIEKIFGPINFEEESEIELGLIEE